jgi:hypothetical protein
MEQVSIMETSLSIKSFQNGNSPDHHLPDVANRPGASLIRTLGQGRR